MLARSLVVLATASLWLAACAGTVATPMVQVPLLRRKGEGEGGLVLGPASRRPEIGGTLRYAATDTLRVGASVSGARGPAVAQGGPVETREQAPKLFADGFLGAEWGGLVLRFGALAGSGYGVRSAFSERCASSEGVVVSCVPAGSVGTDSRFVRSYGQLHLAVSPPGPLAVSLAVRVPVVVELAHEQQARKSELGTEVALTQTLRLRHLRLDLQPLWSRTRGFAFHLALLFRFDAGADERPGFRL
ncbi:MAG: hypothetical protein JWN48_1041 [Myxococcaceae bacterium]|nr:hypothetical protein [Myxococcaceae bacterium]